MSEQTGYSPSFKRPAEIMRMRRKRARSEAGSGSFSCPGQSASSPAGVRPFSPGPALTDQTRSGGGVKRRNPFANIENTFNSPKKRLVIYKDEDQDAVSDHVGSKTETGEEEEEVVVKNERGGGLLFSERLLEAEKQETSSKVGSHLDSNEITRYSDVS